MSASRLALTLWSRLLLGSLARSGVRDVIVSPGSRSTPFAYAALTTPGLTCHSILDERSAGFFALGQARVTGRPSLLLCTSGSAAAQYFPAVVEAAASFTPLLVLTADRPFELQDCGAPQTMDQLKLFGGFVRHFFELGHPDDDAGALDALERIAAQAVARALAPVPGPVHINARAKKPLEPVLPETDAERAAFAAVDARLARPAPRIAAAETRPSPAALGAIAEACRGTERGLLVCGPIAPTRFDDAGALLALSAATGFPVCAEATSQLRFWQRGGASDVIGALDAIARSRAVARFEPELVLQFGAPPTSSGFTRLGGARAVIAAHGHLDPDSRARWIVAADPFAFAQALARELGEQRPPEETAFARAWRQANARYFELVRALDPTEALDEATAVRCAVDALPDGGWLGLGNSLPVRDVDAFVAPTPKSLRVWSQRGLNGIDGLVSGAIGAAQAARVPSLLLVGDVSFLHDVGGLAAAASVDTPLVVLVLDNGGGRIFTGLPVAKVLERHPDLERFWLTPPAVNLEHAAALYRLPYHHAPDARALSDALTRALTHPGVSVVHARIEPDSARRLNQALAERFDRALEADAAE